MEVIYTGIRQTPEQIAMRPSRKMWISSAFPVSLEAHNNLFPKVVQMSKRKKSGDILVFGGGIVPVDDIPELKKAGSGRSFSRVPSTEDYY